MTWRGMRAALLFKKNTVTYKWVHLEREWEPFLYHRILMLRGLGKTIRVAL